MGYFLRDRPSWNWLEWFLRRTSNSLGPQVVKGNLSGQNLGLSLKVRANHLTLEQNDSYTFDESHFLMWRRARKNYIPQVEMELAVKRFWMFFWSFEADGVPTFGVREAYANKNGGQTGSISKRSWG